MYEHSEHPQARGMRLIQVEREMAATASQLSTIDTEMSQLGRTRAELSRRHAELLMTLRALTAPYVAWPALATLQKPLLYCNVVCVTATWYLAPVLKRVIADRFAAIRSGISPLPTNKPPPPSLFGPRSAAESRHLPACHLPSKKPSPDAAPDAATTASKKRRSSASASKLHTR